MATKTISNTPYTISAYFRRLLGSGYLIKVLAQRELKVKYSKAFIGIGWVFLQPFFVVAIYTIFFKNIMKLNTFDVPYPQFVLTGLVLWYLFTGIIGKCAHALLESGSLINKVSFPRMVILLSKISPVVLECLVLLVLSVVVVAVTKNTIGIHVLTTLFYFVYVLVMALAIGVVCSILTLKFRDLLTAIPFVINFAIWLTPVFYSPESIPVQYRPLFRYLNPLSVPMEGLRGALFYDAGISLEAFLLFILSVIFLIGAFIVFVKFEKRIVEKL